MKVNSSFEETSFENEIGCIGGDSESVREYGVGIFVQMFELILSFSNFQFLTSKSRITLAQILAEETIGNRESAFSDTVKWMDGKRKITFS